MFQAFVVTGRIDQLSEQEIHGSAKLLGATSVAITPLLPDLLDVYGVGIRRKLEFRRARNNQPPEADAVVVGRATCTLKLVGDYLTKFEGAADGVPGGPKRATGELHVLPSERPDFKWRVRCDVRAGENMPMSDLAGQTLPSTYVEFGWSLSNISQEAGGA